MEGRRKKEQHIHNLRKKMLLGNDIPIFQLFYSVIRQYFIKLIVYLCNVFKSNGFSQKKIGKDNSKKK